MMAAEGDYRAAWEAAAKREGDLLELLRSVPYLGAPDLRGRLFDPIASLLKDTKEPAVRAAAVSALAWTREDGATFSVIPAKCSRDPTRRGPPASARCSACPARRGRRTRIEPLARALVASLGKLASRSPRRGRGRGRAAAGRETRGCAAGRAPPRDPARAARARRAGRRIQAVPEQMLFDVKWFAVEAGKPVQIVLATPTPCRTTSSDQARAHCRRSGRRRAPCRFRRIPAAKAYVPDTPLVLQATRLLNWGETERLSFTAPAAGEYPFVCTFPGHWVRMYGVMLVVDNLEAWEAQALGADGSDDQSAVHIAAQIGRGASSTRKRRRRVNLHALRVVVTDSLASQPPRRCNILLRCSPGRPGAWQRIT